MRSPQNLVSHIEFKQSNSEHQLIDWIHAARTSASGLVINPGRLFAHLDCNPRRVEGVRLPIIEVHISNIHRREDFRHHSYVSLAATGVIAGLGAEGYASGPPAPRVPG